jgi:hypothetical protein
MPARLSPEMTLPSPIEISLVTTQPREERKTIAAVVPPAQPPVLEHVPRARCLLQRLGVDASLDLEEEIAA